MNVEYYNLYVTFHNRDNIEDEYIFPLDAENLDIFKQAFKSDDAGQVMLDTIDGTTVGFYLHTVKLWTVERTTDEVYDEGFA